MSYSGFEKLGFKTQRLTDRRRYELLSAVLANPKKPSVGVVDPEERAFLNLALEELLEGGEFLQWVQVQFPRRVTVFGSARSNMNPSVYESAHRLGARLAHDHIAVITGGGPGIMEAVSRGAHEAGGTTIGFGVNIKSEPPSQYLTHSIRFHPNNLFIRQELLIRSGGAYVLYPGGFGTAFEFFHLLTLIQLARINKVPIIVVGKAYWGELQTWIQEQMVKDKKTIKPTDLELFRVVGSDEEAHHILSNWFAGLKS